MRLDGFRCLRAGLTTLQRSIPVLSAALAALFLASTQLHGQRTSGLAGGVRPELRVDVRWAGAPDGQAMLGGSIPLDRSLRLAFLAGAGVERSGGERVASVMAEVHARLLLDPLGSRRFGWYGALGLGYRAAEERSPRAYLLALGGVEGPRLMNGRVRTALEAGVGDGVRVGIAVRASRSGAR